MIGNALSFFKRLFTRKSEAKYADCVLRDERGRFCLLQRSYQSDFEPGKWCLPGGHIDEGEDSLTAAHRELEEETGYKDVRLNYIGSVKHEDKSVSDYYEGFVWSHQLTVLDNDEHYRIEWIKPEDLDNYELMLDTKEILQTIPLSPLAGIPSPLIIGEDLYTLWQLNSHSFNEDRITTDLFYKHNNLYKSAAAFELLCRAFDNDDITLKQFEKILSFKKTNEFRVVLQKAAKTDNDLLEKIIDSTIEKANREVERNLCAEEIDAKIEQNETTNAYEKWL